MCQRKKVSLAGQFFERISEYVESEITVTAMAVEASGEQMKKEYIIQVHLISLLITMTKNTLFTQEIMRKYEGGIML